MASPFRTISVAIRADVTQYRAAMAQVAATTRATAQQVATEAGAGNRALRDMGRTAVVAGAVVAAGLGLAVREAVRFEAQMRNVNSIARESEAQFARTSQQVLEMARRFPQSAETLAAGLYDITSSGFKGADALRVLESAALSATAGLTTTATASRAITAVLNAFNMQASESAHIADVLFQTVNLGVITFEELSQGIGDWIGTARAAGVSFEEASAALATMTLSGITAAEAGTSLNRVMLQFVDPSDAMREALEEIGYESGVAAIQAVGLRGAMEELAAAGFDDVESLNALFDEVRGLRGALALTAGEGGNFARVAEGMEEASDGAGAATLAFREQSKSLAVQMAATRATAGAFAIEIGARLIPVVRTVVGFLGDMFDAFSDLPGPVKTLLTYAGLLVTVVGLLGGGFLVLAPRIHAARVAFTALQAKAPQAAAAMSTVGKVAGGVGLALTAVSLVLGVVAAGNAEAEERTRGYTEALREQGEAAETAARTLMAEAFADSGLSRLARDAGVELERLAEIATTSGTSVEDGLDAVNAAFTSGASDFAEAVEMAGLAGTELGDVILDLAAAGELNRYNVTELLGPLAEQAEAYAAGASAAAELEGAEQDLNVATEEEISAIEQLGAEARLADMSLDDLTDTQKGLLEAIRQMLDPLNAFGDALDDKRGLMEAFADEQLEMARSAHEAGQITDEELRGIEDAYGSMVDNVSLSLAEYAGALEQANARTALWQQNLVTVAARTGADVAQIIAGMGEEGVRLAELMATGTDEEVLRMAEALRENAQAGAAGAAVELEAGLAIAETAARQGANGIANAIADRLELSVGQVRQIARGYGIALADALNPVLTAAGGAPIRNVFGNDPSLFRPTIGQFAQGSEDHRAQVAPAGAWRLWAEPETGGEAYIPLAPAKRPRSVTVLRSVAKRFGYRLEEFADGGEAGVPRPPAANAHALDADERWYAKAYDAVVARVRQAEQIAATSLSGSATGLDPEFLRRYNEYNATLGGILRIVSGFRSRTQQAALYARWLARVPGQAPAAPPGRSKHERGLAIDHSPHSTSRMRAVAGEHGLRYPMSYEPWHVEPMAKGGILNPHVRDRGGLLLPGYTLNATGRPEVVLPFRTGGVVDPVTGTVVEGNAFIGPDGSFVLPGGRTPGSVGPDNRSRAERDRDGDKDEVVIRVYGPNPAEWSAGIGALEEARRMLAESNAIVGAVSGTRVGQRIRQYEKDPVEEAAALQEVAALYMRVRDEIGLAAADALVWLDTSAEGFADMANAALEAQAEITEAAEKATDAVLEQVNSLADIYQAASDAYDDQFRDYLDTVERVREEVTGALEDVYSSAQQRFADQAEEYEEVIKRRNERIAQEMERFRETISGPVTGLGDLISTFGLEQPGADEIVAMLDHRVEAAHRWSDALLDLRTSGLNDELVTQLAQAGPDALGLAEALREMDPTALNSRLAELAATGQSLADVFGADALGGITSEVNADLPLPEMRSFNDLLAEEIRLWEEASLARGEASSWAESMVDQYMPAVNFEWRTFDDLLAEEIALNLHAATGRQAALEWAAGMTGQIGTLANEYARLLAVKAAAEGGASGGHFGSFAGESGLDRVARITGQIAGGVRSFEDVRRSLGLATGVAGVGVDAAVVAEGPAAVARRVEQMLRNAGQTFDVGGELMPGWTYAYNGTGRPETVTRGPAATYRIEVPVSISAAPGTDTAAVERAAERGVGKALGIAVDKLRMGAPA